jgi:4-amino-4-deoxy-L-arabinose transferase and related glycosyltransferases of PMT family
MQKVSVQPHIPEATSTKPKESKNLLLLYGLDLLIVIAMGFLLYHGLFGQTFSDVPIYECYAVAFLRGFSALNTLPLWQCSFLIQPQGSFISTAALVHWMQVSHFPAALIQFIEGQNLNFPLHSLPREYPLLAIIPFVLPLLVSSLRYEMAFAISMFLVAIVIYGLLRYFRSRWAAYACALYLVIGGWALADGRFDLVPSALTLVAIIFGVRKRWCWAFAFLALAVVCKFYPLVLLLPFLLAQQLTSDEKWTSWRRFTPLAVFAVVFMAVMAVSLCLSIEGTLAPLIYYGDRPFQIESAGASILWLCHFLGYSLSPTTSYGSVGVISPLTFPVSLINATLLGVGLAYTGWLQWRGKIDLATSCLLMLMIVIFTGKVFSPQYLLWLIPLAAYVGEWKSRWIVAWCLLGGLTTYIFPYLYMIFIGHLETIVSIPFFCASIAMRNLFFFYIIVSLLFSYSRGQSPQLPSEGSTADMSEILASPMCRQEEISPIADAVQPLLLWHKFALGGVLAIAAGFNFFFLTRQDFFEYYYAAGIKSMLISWHDLFFAAFDPAGFLALDKPPLGFWIQALSVKLFGFSTFNILLPEALAGVLAVALLFHLVRRVFGPLAGLIAALVLAISPISVATNRNNIVDSLLVLTTLLAAWMVCKAAETGRLRWLCLCAVMVGLGFNIKYLQAYMVIPAFALVYLLGTALHWRTKLCHSAVALGVLLLVSLCWATAVDLTPANQRPTIDSTPANSELNLAFGYNGTFRLTADSGVVDTWAWEIGRPGIARFFEQPVAGQSSWLLPLALLGLLALSWQGRWRLPLNRQQSALVLWGTWLLTLLVFFNNVHFFHLYYLSLLSPAIAALVGAGVVALWRDYIHQGWHGKLLPYALLVTGAVQSYFLAPFPQWNSILAVNIIGCCSAIGLVLILMRWRFGHSEDERLPGGERPLIRRWQARGTKLRKEQRLPAHLYTAKRRRIIVLGPGMQRFSVVTTSVGLLSLLLAPTVWAAIPVSLAGRAFPMAGPPAPQTSVPPLVADPVLIHYLLAHKDTEQYLLATINTEAAAPFIVDTGLPVMALGGYSGNSGLLTSDQLIQQIAHGTVRFFLLPSSSDQAATWVMAHCGEVPTKQWQSSSTDNFSVDSLQLYDCAHRT